MLREATSVQASGRDLVLDAPAAWGLGFAVDEDGFGMGGAGGSFGWWSRAGRYAFAFLTGYVAGHDRGDRLENAFRACRGFRRSEPGPARGTRPPRPGAGRTLPGLHHLG